MNKFLTLVVLVVTISWQSTFAVVPIPKNTISVEPLVAENGSPIKISALIYNPQKETTIFSVEFKAGEVSLGKAITTVSALGAKTVSVEWKQPKIKTDVSVTIISALDKQKKDITLLHGLVGNISLGSEDIKTKPSISLGGGKIGITFSDLFSKLEAFRKKKSVYFVTLRDEAKKNLGMETKDDIIKKISPIFSPPATGPVIDSDTVPQEELSLTGYDSQLQAYKVGDSKSYFTLAFSTAMASFFSSSLFFYALSIIVLIFLLRLIFKIFS